MNLDQTRMKLFHAAKRPPHMRKDPVAATKRPNGLDQFREGLARAHTLNATIEKDITRITEGVEKIIVNEMVSKEQVRAWLDRAQSVVSERSDQIHSTEEKDKFVLLSNTIKNFTPVAEASDEDVMRSLTNLKQNIVIDENDSDHLVSVKKHLTAEIEKMLS